MNNSFTKLFSTLIHSSIWNEDDKTRVLWITMLAIADKNGEVGGSIGGLAHAARMSKEDCERCLSVLYAPDPDSTNPANEGRRIEKVERGWRILNYQTFRERGRHIDRAEYLAKKQREYRLKKKKVTLGEGITRQEPEHAERCKCVACSTDPNDSDSNPIIYEKTKESF